MLIAPVIANAFEQQLEEAEAAAEADQQRAVQLASDLLALEDLSDTGRLRALIVSCGAGVRVEGPKAALPQCQQAVALAETNSDKTLLLRARNVRGTAFYGLGQITDAFADFSAALTMARQLDDLTLTSRLANNLGVVARNTGALEQSIEYFRESIEVAKDTGYDYMQAVASINLGDTYTQLERFEGAYPYLEQGLEAAQRTADDTLSLNANISIAETLTKQGYPTQAIAHLRPLITPAQAQQRNVAVAAGYEVLAKAYSGLDRQSEAIEHLGIALDMTEELDALRHHHRLLVELARLERLDNDLEGALATIAAPIQFAREHNNDMLLQTALREQTRVLAELEQPDQALASDREADGLERAFNTRRANEQLSILRVQTEQARTERQLALALQRQTAIELRAQQERRVRNGTLIALAFTLGLAYLWYNRRRNTELERLVAQRTQDLLEETETRHRLEAQLAQAQKLEAIGQLTGGIAHDFNNLLMVILGALDLLRSGGEGRLTTEDQALIDDALAAVQSGANITQQLLASARKPELRPEKFDLATHVKDLQRLLARSLGAERHLAVTGPPGPLPVRLDSGQLTSAILNLLINARDATAENGHVIITLQSRQIEADDPIALNPGRYACISVRDNGRGMSPEDLQQACKPFFSTKPLAAVSGLGLSMVYGFVKRSAGELTITSEVGEGTEVELFLPLATEEATETPPVGADLVADPASG